MPDETNITQGGITQGAGSQFTVGAGDITGRDKISAGRDVIQAGEGATVVISGGGEVELTGSRRATRCSWAARSCWPTWPGG